jgi:galactofuranose transport system substrate-binding protein
MRKIIKLVAIIAILAMVSALAACGSSSSTSSSASSAVVAASTAATAAPAPTAAPADKKIVFGFAQVGAESGWRTANTKSIQDEAAKQGIELKFSDAQQKQENQIKAIRSYIAQKVDVIGFSPVVETGWDAVLKEAKDAGIPVILTDRAVKMTSGNAEDYYVTFLGSDFVVEGQNIAKWLLDNADKLGLKGDVNIYELEGTVGSAPAIDRKKGFDETIKTNPKFHIAKSQSGNFTRAEGQQVMESWLKSDKDKIQVVFAHNDDMAIGCIQAIEAAGLKPGVDIKIISIDGVKDAFTAMAAGKLNASQECNPLLGPQVMDLVKQIVAGKAADIPKRILSNEKLYEASQAAAALPDRQY